MSLVSMPRAYKVLDRCCGLDILQGYWKYVKWKIGHRLANTSHAVRKNGSRCNKIRWAWFVAKASQPQLRCCRYTFHEK